MKLKKGLVGLILIVLFINLIGCSDTTKFNKLDTLEKQVKFFNEYSDDFEATATIFTKNDNMRYITSSKSWLNLQNDQVMEERDGIYFQSMTKFSDIEYKEYTTIAKKICFNDKIQLVVLSDDCIEFIYASTMGKSIGWAYSKSGTEPDQKEHYITKLQKINDNWYACVWH